MNSKRKSVCLSCIFCAVLSGILWLLLSRGTFVSIAAAQETPAVEKVRPEVDKKGESIRDSERHHSVDGIGKFYMGREIGCMSDGISCR